MEKLKSPRLKGFYKSKFHRTIDWRHDYTRMNEEANNIYNMIDEATSKTIDAAAEYANQWVILTGHKEGLAFCVSGIWKLISRIFGTFDYHLNFFASFNEQVDRLDDILTEKQEELERKTSKIGFANRP